MNKRAETLEILAYFIFVLGGIFMMIGIYFEAIVLWQMLGLITLLLALGSIPLGLAEIIKQLSKK